MGEWIRPRPPYFMVKQKSHHTLRIIGGEWRGKRLEFPVLRGVRPTPDRVRETLFNWLTPLIQGARCLDLYTGSGALGLEAASRGAAQVIMVDREPAMIEALGQHCAQLNSKNIELIQMDALKFLRKNQLVFDVVFLDPPFLDDLLEQSLATLLSGSHLSMNARVYVEMNKFGERPVLPVDWEYLRSKTAGQVAYYLLARVFDD